MRSRPISNGSATTDCGGPHQPDCDTYGSGAYHAAAPNRPYPSRSELTADGLGKEDEITAPLLAPAAASSVVQERLMASEATPSTKLLQMLEGYRVVQALYVAAQLGIADQLESGPRHSEDVARATGTHARSLHRLLRALASLDIVEEHPDGRFSLTPVGEQLRSDAPGSLRAAVIFFGGRRHWTAWGQLLDSVKSGETVFGSRSHDAFLRMAALDPEGARVFNEAMVALTGPVNASVATAYDFSRIGTLVDVGGGYGALLSGILAANPRLRGILFDIPPVIEGARGRIEAAGLAGRCEVIAGDVFEAVPGGGDAYILKWIIHDWSDELSITILKNCGAAMRNDGKLLLVERVLPQRAEASADTVSKFLSDLNMLLLAGGCERTEEEYRALLAAAGFELTRIVPTATPQCIIEATPS